MGWMSFHTPTTKKQTKFEKTPEITANNVRNLIEASYQKNRDAKQIGKRGGYKLDKQLSNREQKVFSDKDGNPYVTYTGTRKAGDWVTDGALAVGLLGTTKRLKDSKQLIRDVRDKYQNKPVTTMGHSLGGSLAEASGGDKVITLDKGVGLFGIGKKINSNQTDIRTQSDPVSVLSRFQSGGQKVNIPNSNFIDPIHAHNFRHISRLNTAF
jgi:hypothetical protein